MIVLVVDASVLVAELLRRRGRELFAHPDLRCLVAEDQLTLEQRQPDSTFTGVCTDRNTSGFPYVPEFQFLTHTDGYTGSIYQWHMVATSSAIKGVSFTATSAEFYIPPPASQD